MGGHTYNVAYVLYLEVVPQRDIRKTMLLKRIRMTRTSNNDTITFVGEPLLSNSMCERARVRMDYRESSVDRNTTTETPILK